MLEKLFQNFQSYTSIFPCLTGFTISFLNCFCLVCSRFLDRNLHRKENQRMLQLHKQIATIATPETLGLFLKFLGAIVISSSLEWVRRHTFSYLIISPHNMKYWFSIMATSLAKPCVSYLPLSFFASCKSEPGTSTCKKMEDTNLISFSIFPYKKMESFSLTLLPKANLHHHHQKTELGWWVMKILQNNQDMSKRREKRRRIRS